MSKESTEETRADVRNGKLRLVLVGISLIIEIAVILVLFLRFSKDAAWVILVTRGLAVLLVLGIYSSHDSASVKMPWIILITALPILGTVLFLLIGLNSGTWKMRVRYKTVDDTLLPMLTQDVEVGQRLRAVSPYVDNIARYLYRDAGYPVYDGTEVTYFDDATKGLEAHLHELAKAKDFIFMEYHAIEDAEAWHSIQRVLEDRVKAGVEVRVFYDDMGSIGFINTDFVDRLEAKGIKCRVFNPFKLGLNLFLNNRDHRKITVIDGKVGFTGGYNLANEYFHLTEPFGFWKDTGIMLRGDAVQSLTVTFLQMWNAAQKKGEKDDYARYLPDPVVPKGVQGFVQPYADNPLDDKRTGEDVYMSLAEAACDYVWFVTPYLILTDEFIRALGLAAKRGVDVRVITPGIPDKKLIYKVTRSYYNALGRNGVRIYEYTPGFCHAKMCVMDGVAATCGTINLDYRSLYHHFENGCLFSDCQAVADVKADFDEMLGEAREVTADYTTGRSAWLRLSQLVLRLFAPLM